MKHFLLLVFLLFAATPSYGGDHKQLFEKISAMAEAGDMEAAYHLGMFYNNGIATPINIKAAYKWFSISGEAHDPLGAYKLGCYFAGQAGDIVAYDAEKALYYKLISAEAGYSLAQYDVGLAYLDMGEADKAAKFLTLAARQGMASALQALTALNYQGTMFEKDLAKARAYGSLLELLLRDELSAETVTVWDKLEREMSDEDIKLSNKIIAEWKVNKTTVTAKAAEGLMRSYTHADLKMQ